MNKPHITRYFFHPDTGSRSALVSWRCSGAGMVGYGRNPSACYRSWRIQHDAEQARRRAAGMP